MNIKDEHTSRLWTFIMKGEIMDLDDDELIATRVNNKSASWKEVEEYIEKYYVSKDKIKNIINQLEKEQEQNRKELARGIDYLSNEMIESASKKIGINMDIREYLQELLQKGEIMSEYDIIDIAERIANFGWSDYDDFEKNKQAIQGLLDLYNKEKEKNKSIEAQRLRDMCYKTDGNYISKDKIKEKIEELEKFGAMLDKESTVSRFTANVVSIRYLKDLLEESE